MSADSTASGMPPRAVVISKLDTLGDLVVFAPALRALRTAWPATKLVLVVRRPYLDLAAMLLPGGANVEWVATSIDPFAKGPEAEPSEVTRLRELVAAIAPEFALAASSRRTWLDLLIAAATNAPRRIALGVDEDPHFTTNLELNFGLAVSSVFTERVAVEPDAPDWQRNFRLVSAAIGQPLVAVAPALETNPAGRDIAADFLAANQLARGDYIVCAAAGFANVSLKTWPAANFASVLSHVRRTHGLRAVLIGHESERDYLESVQAASGESALVWLGREGSLPALTGLIAAARLFLGNDTGAMHLAAALDVPVVAVFGGGTWPRFVPAGRRAVSVVQPLPCFGCGWDCAFGDAPCVKTIPDADVTAAVDDALARLARSEPNFSVIQPVEELAPEMRELMGAAAARYRTTAAELVLRQRQIEQKERAIAEKEREIDALKVTCDEREKLIVRVDGHARALTKMVHDFQSELNQLRSDHDLLQKSVAALPAEDLKAVRTVNDQLVHIRNIESILQAREAEVKELRATQANRTAGLHDLEQAKHYGRLLAEKEAAIQYLRRGNAERDEAIKKLAADATGPAARLGKLWTAASVHAREKWYRPFDGWLFKKIVEEHWMHIGELRHYAPRRLAWDRRIPGPRLADAQLPQIGVVTPSYGQEKFIERTMLSVLEQHYPKLLYVVQDGGSKDDSPGIIARHAARLHAWESVKDDGQADAIRRGFTKVEGSLAPDAIMAWLNSDDLLAPRSLRFVAEYFAAHPNVDVIYGHRIIIDEDDHEIGRWIMPRHKPATLEWIDYVPQETLFWRKRAWDLVGGIDPTFQFALDWDLLARFQQAGCRMVRVPYFLGAFRVHAAQKTSQDIHTTGAEEMRRIRTRFHGENQDNGDTIAAHARDARFWGAVTARLHAVGIRW